MYITPIGTNPPSDEDRQPIYWTYNGDQIEISSRLTLKDGHSHVTPSNSRLVFALAENQFCTDSIWEGTWNDGITEADPLDHPGLVLVRIPEDIGDSLRRGSYRFSIAVTNRFGRDEYTPVVGTLMMEYAPTSPNHSIAYKDGA